MKTVALESSKVELEIWDTAGQGTRIQKFASAYAHPSSSPTTFLSPALTLTCLHLNMCAKQSSLHNLDHHNQCQFRFTLVCIFCAAETYRSILPLYYRGAAIVVLVYDITNKVGTKMMRVALIAQISMCT